MRFHRVRLRNLNSLYGEQVIDFEEDIRSSPLFLIIGPTGAGKSTILDAICLALFGQTPRLGRKAGRAETDVAHIMSIGQSAAHAEVEFSVLGPDQKRSRFLATWSSRRAYDDPEGAVQRPERSLYRIFDDGTMRLMVADHREKYFQPAFDEALRGLSVDDFKRSILLAQGEFSAFLHASDSDKASILERLTSTEDYRVIGERAARRRRLVEDRHRALLAKLEEMQVLTVAQEEELAAEIAAAETRASELRKLAAVARRKVEWLERLEELEQVVHKAQEGVGAVEERQAERAADYQRLHRDGELQVVEPSWREVQRQIIAAKSIAESLEPLAGQIAELEKASEDAASAVEKARESLEVARKAATAAEPEIRKAHELRTRREVETRELESARAELEKRSKSCEELAAQRKAILEELDAAQERAKELVETRDALAKLRPLLQRLDALNATYADGIAPLDARIAALGTEITELEEARAAKAGELATFDESMSELSKQRSTLQGQVTKAKKRLDAALGEFPSVKDALDTLSTRHGAANAKAEALREAKYLLTRIREAETQRDELWERVAGSEKEVSELEREERDLKELEGTYRTLLNQCNESLRQNERLIALSAYRRDLEHGLPCPLCGSPIHPYCESDELEEVDREAQADRERLEKQRDEAREKVQAANEKVQRLATNFAARKTALRHDEGRLVSVKLGLEEDQSAFAKCVTKAGYAPLEAFQLKNVERLETDLEEASRVAAETRDQLGEIEEARQQLDRAEEKLEALDGERRTAEESTTQLRSEAASLEDRISTRRQDIDKANADRAQRAAAITEELESFGIEVVSLREGLDSAAGKREALATADAAAEEAAKKVTELEASAERVAEKIATAQTDVAASQKVVDGRSATLADLEEKIAACLGGREPAEVKEELEAKVRAAREALDTAAASKAETAEQLSACRARREDLQERAKRAEEALKSANEKLDAVLEKLGIEREEVEANLLDPEQRRALRQELEVLDKELTRAKTRLDDATKSLDRHLEEPLADDDETLELATAALQAANEQLNAATLELGALRERWQKHEKTKSRRGELEEELREVQHDLDVWNTIYGLIGVREGERFKLFAQSLNLQGLVDRANDRLEKLHPRYRLTVARGDGGEPTLAFGVLDRYQASVERPLTTLSGGETFLVSLALALGLADMRRVDMPIETLLLDEGFGTLDQDSLHMALSTLHQLHYDASRQIGIISHVDALKELIDARIVVDPVGHGRSQIRFEFGANLGRGALRRVLPESGPRVSP